MADASGYLEKEIICILCPLGCRGKVSVDERGKVNRTRGYRCKLGKQHAAVEGEAPVRVFTGTVTMEGGRRPLLPVRSDRPIPKDLVMSCARLLSEIRVRPPIKLGEVVLPDILNSGVSVISSTSVED